MKPKFAPFLVSHRIGKFLLFLRSTVVNTEPFSVYPKLVIEEMILIGFNSLFLVILVSGFIGAVTAVQTANNLVSPLVPRMVIGTITRDMVLLELSTTFTSVILAGKIGSNIAGNLGTMRITEQIDALEVMGINSSSYLVLPKIIAGVTMFPLITIISAFIGIYGGYLASVAGGLITPYEFESGLRSQFNEDNVPFALVKAVVFGFLITSISSYQGFYTRGGSLEVGQSSTLAVTNSCIALLVADFVLAQSLL